MPLKIPFLDLAATHESLREELEDAIRAVISGGIFVGGPFVEVFEREFAAFCACEHAAGVGSGTEALWLALLACGVGPGDEVVTVPSTFIATAEAISYCGAKPVFVDVEERSRTMDPARLEAAITPKTRAVVPVHLFGQPADMDPILAIARERRIFVIEDACQAHGAEYKGRRAGSMGDAGCFSFYPGKNLGALGEAGAVVTNNSELARRVRMLRDHGQARKYHHTFVGWNSRMDGIQAAVLRVKLKRLEEWNAARRRNAAFYNDLLAGEEGVATPVEAPYARHVYHLYAPRVPHRDRLIAALAEEGIECGIHYPVPLHLQEAYRPLNHRRGDFPEAERLAEEVLSLPMYPELTLSRIERVAESLKKHLRALTPSSQEPVKIAAAFQRR